MNNTPTPETDAVAEKLNFGVDIDFARKLERERDELRQWKKEMLFVESQWDEQMVGRLLGLQLGDYIKANIEPKLRQLIRERDEARAKLSRKQQTLTIAEGTISDLRKQRDEWSAMCSRYKQERDIAEQDATNYHARIIELSAERDKTKQERDEARYETAMWALQRDEAREAAAKWEAVALREASINGARICAKEETK